jgi:PAS domain S-box-containing protein
MTSDRLTSSDLIKEAMKQKSAVLTRAGKILTNATPQDRNGKNGSGRPIGATELEAAIQRYVDLYELAPVAYISFDRAGRIGEANLAATQLLDCQRKALIGRPFAVYVATEDSNLFLNHLLRCRSCKDSVETELRLRKGDGEIIFAHLSSRPTISPMRDGARLYQTTIVDLTQQKKAEKELRESEERHRAIVNQSAVGIARTNLKGKLVFANRKFCEMLGYKESELIGKSILDITHRDDIRESRTLFQRIVNQGTPYELEKRYVRKDGSILWVRVSASPIRDTEGKTKSAAAIILDITEQKKAQVLLEERARGLEGEILEISDREQRRIGQDLHDSVCQHLTAIAFMARSMAVRLKNHRVVEVEDIEKIAELINDGVTEARTIARGLHPVEMDPAGLAVALQSLLHRRSKLPYRLDMDEELAIADPKVALHLYRIASEAVINANKHAHARELVVHMRRSSKQIELSVTDDGVGIDKNRGDGSGMGFHIMDYRARSIGARLEIKSVKPHGTRVACYVPRK